MFNETLFDEIIEFLPYGTPFQWLEKDLILSPDIEFRFHSGNPNCTYEECKTH